MVFKLQVMVFNPEVKPVITEEPAGIAAELPGTAASIILPSKNGNALVVKAESAMHTNARINFPRYGRRYLKSMSVSFNDSLLIFALGDGFRSLM